MLYSRPKIILWKLIIFVSFIILAGNVFALEGSFSLQGGGVQAFQGDGQNLNPNFGVNGFLNLDFKLTSSFSLGVGSGLTALINRTKRIYIDGTLLTGRWSPWAQSDWTPYLMGGAGFRPFRELDSEHRWWPGDFQGTAGVGVRHTITKGLELDVTAFYDYNPFSDDPLHSIGLRAGIAFPFGAPDRHYSWKAGDTPEKLAVRLYGDPKYSDALIVANKNIFAKGYIPAPGERILTPSLKAMNYYLTHSTELRSKLVFPFESPEMYYAWKAVDTPEKLAVRYYGDKNFTYPLKVANYNLFLNGRIPSPDEEILIPSLEAMNYYLTHPIGLRAKEGFPFGTSDRQYSWKKGDTPEKIAVRFYGDIKYKDALLAANNTLFTKGSIPSPGEQILIPCLEAMNYYLTHYKVPLQKYPSEFGTYLVHKGDNLWGISRMEYGLGHKWRRIFKANSNKIYNPNLIYPDENLLIPDGAQNKFLSEQKK